VPKANDEKNSSDDDRKEAPTAGRAHPRDPLHGITLQRVVEQLYARYGWEELGRRIPIRCFTNDPSLGSSLVFLRRQPWARQQVEELFLRSRSESSAHATPTSIKSPDPLAVAVAADQIEREPNAGRGVFRDAQLQPCGDGARGLELDVDLGARPPGKVNRSRPE
jgi:uncharacterized protein (DUF2132 family)